jgi:outer membrane protein OmpA-like peptidoglycan-associated protein
VFFDFDKYAITPEAQQILLKAAAAAKDQKASAVLLAGHTDTSGSAEYNLGLSARRADAVKAAMASLGIPTSAINTQALGETMPLVPTGDGVREPQNRRVEISFR